MVQVGFFDLSDRYASLNAKREGYEDAFCVAMSSDHRKSGPCPGTIWQGCSGEHRSTCRLRRNLRDRPRGL